MGHISMQCQNLKQHIYNGSYLNAMSKPQTAYLSWIYFNDPLIPLLKTTDVLPLLLTKDRKVVKNVNES